MSEYIDRTKVRDPREVSGWGARTDGPSRQDFSDIAKQSEQKPEFERGQTTVVGRADGSSHATPVGMRL